MTKLLCGSALALPLALCAVPAHAEAEPASPLTDTIVVTGQRTDPAEAVADPVTGHASAADAAALLTRLPGGALVGNGPISGQAQFRGLFSDRLAIRVGGQSFQTGGPNAMDPPLHYAPTILLDRITVSRGAAPVSEGPGLGALVEAHLKQVAFGESAALAPAASLGTSYRSTGDDLALGGVVGLASQQFRINAIAAWEEGSDYRIPGGRVADTSYQRMTYGLSGALRTNGNTLSLDLRRQETGSSGNPPYAMDIDYFDTDFARIAFDGAVGGHKLDLVLGFTDVRHGMDNFSRRPPPPTTGQYRYSYAEAQTLSGSAKLGLGPLTVGIDAMGIDRLVNITNPTNPAFSIGSLERVAQSRWGGFAELAGRLGDWRADLGMRIDRHRASMAAPLVGPAVPAMIANLARATGAALTPRQDTTWDLVARLWHNGGTIDPRLTLSRKSRIANAVERFSWLPTEASGGLADGNIYIGNPALDPEIAWAAEGGLDIDLGAVTLRPSLFYRRIDGYIQGTPVPPTMATELMIAAMNGDATPLRFTNTDAELTGIDADLGWQMTPDLRLDAVISYVRGKRRDTADNLYRIAPLNGRAALTYRQQVWSASAELVWAAAQHKVSASNGESASPGWAIVNLWAEWQLSPGLRLSGGVENVFDRRYADHLAGINRIRLSDVAVGNRLPGTGRSAFLRLGFDF